MNNFVFLVLLILLASCHQNVKTHQAYKLDGFGQVDGVEFLSDTKAIIFGTEADQFQGITTSHALVQVFDKPSNQTSTIGPGHVLDVCRAGDNLYLLNRVITKVEGAPDYKRDFEMFQSGIEDVGWDKIHTIDNENDAGIDYLLCQGNELLAVGWDSLWKRKGDVWTKFQRPVREELDQNVRFTQNGSLVFVKRTQLLLTDLNLSVLKSIPLDPEFHPKGVRNSGSDEFLIFGAPEDQTKKTKTVLYRWKVGDENVESVISKLPEDFMTQDAVFSQGSWVLDGSFMGSTSFMGIGTGIIQLKNDGTFVEIAKSSYDLLLVKHDSYLGVLEKLGPASKSWELSLVKLLTK